MSKRSKKGRFRHFSKPADFPPRDHPHPIYNDDTAHTFILHFDGSCNPNPGGHRSYGFGWQIVDGYDSPIASTAEPCRYEPRTNNTAEWCGLISGLSYLLTSRNLHIGRVVIHGDSQLVLRQLTGTMKCKASHLVLLRDQARVLIQGLDCPWETAWIPREQNEECDRLSKMNSR